MTFAEFVAEVQQLAALIGPNAYLQAAIIAVLFIVVGKVADWIISRVLGRFARKSSNDFDDGIVDLLHKPVFLSFVLLGLTLATNRLGLPDVPEFLTTGVLKTLAIFVWYNTLMQLMALVVRAFSKKRDRQIVQTGMLSLLHNVMKIVLVAMMVYFLFLAWTIDVTAWLASAGIVGLALSFAAKDTLSNLFAAAHAS